MNSKPIEQLKPEKQNIIFAGIPKNKFFFNLSRKNETWKEYNYIVNLSNRIKKWIENYKTLINEIENQNIFTRKNLAEYRSNLNYMPKLR